MKQTIKETKQPVLPFSQMAISQKDSIFKIKVDLIAAKNDYIHVTLGY